MAKILLLNGPNLNLLGLREPDHYGEERLEEIEKGLIKQASSEGHTLETLQSNAEHELVERIHQAANDSVDGIIINPAAFTHTSIAIRDALRGVDIPFIEVHLSNIYSREAFRKHSYFSDLACGVISGLGAHGYSLALAAILRQIDH